MAERVTSVFGGHNVGKNRRSRSLARTRSLIGVAANLLDFVQQELPRSLRIAHKFAPHFFTKFPRPSACQ